MEGVVAPVVFAAVVVSVAMYFAGKEGRQRLLLYRQVANRYPGSTVKDGGFWRNHELYVARDSVRIKVWMWATKNSRGTVWEVRTDARFPRFRIYREGVGSSFGKSVFGTQDIELGGHAGFDEHFMVKGDDPPLIRQVWGKACCDRMLSLFPKCRVESDGGELKLTEYRLLKSAPELEAGIELIGDLAVRDVYGVSALKKLDGAEYQAGALPSVIVRGPSNVEIGPFSTPEGTVTRASCLAGAGDDEPPPEQLDAIGATFSRSDKRLQLTWPGIETSTDRLAGAVELLRELSRGPSLGVFR